MGGRMLGLAFFAPCVYFWSKGYFNAILKQRMLIAGILMAAQVSLIYSSMS